MLIIIKFYIGNTLYEKGRFKADKFFVFEAIGKNKERGESMLVVHEDLNPILIKEYEKSFEMIVVEIKTEKKPIRVITGNGPQKTGRRMKECPFGLLWRRNPSKGPVRVGVEWERRQASTVHQARVWLQAPVVADQCDRTIAFQLYG